MRQKRIPLNLTLNLCARTNLAIDNQQRFNGGYFFLQDIYYELGLDKIFRKSILLSMTSMISFPDSFIQESFFRSPKRAVLSTPDGSLRKRNVCYATFMGNHKSKKRLCLSPSIVFCRGLRQHSRNHNLLIRKKD